MMHFLECAFDKKGGNIVNISNTGSLALNIFFPIGKCVAQTFIYFCFRNLYEMLFSPKGMGGGRGGLKRQKHTPHFFLNNFKTIYSWPWVPNFFSLFLSWHETGSQISRLNCRTVWGECLKK